MVRIVALGNEKLGIDIPQMVFERRADELIDIAGFARLTEKVIWRAIENTDIPYEDSIVRKETIGGSPALHLYLELKNGYVGTEKGIESAVHNQLRKLDSDYADLESMVGVKPLKVSLLPEGAFKAFMEQRQAEGADLAHIKPNLNPSDKVLSLLTAEVEAAPKVAVAAGR